MVSNDRAKLRSRTYDGIGKAMAEQWSDSNKVANQCDGCKLGLPIKDGIHMNYNESSMNNKFHMVCTSKTYGEE